MAAWSVELGLRKIIKYLSAPCCGLYFWKAHCLECLCTYVPISHSHIIFIFFDAVPTAGKGAPENSAMEFEAKSGRDGAWSLFNCHSSLG